MTKNNVVITEACRTAVGSLGKTLKNVKSHELGAKVISQTPLKISFYGLQRYFGVKNLKNQGTLLLQQILTFENHTFRNFINKNFRMVPTFLHHYEA